MRSGQVSRTTLHHQLKPTGKPSPDIFLLLYADQSIEAPYHKFFWFFGINSSKCSTSPPLRRISRHIIPDPLIIQQPLYRPQRTHRDIPIPDLPRREIHHILLGNTSNDPLNLSRVHSSPRRHDLAANILGHGGGAVERQQNGGFELRFGALGFRFGHIEGEARPFAQGEVDEVVDAGDVVGDEVDAP